MLKRFLVRNKKIEQLNSQSLILDLLYPAENPKHSLKKWEFVTEKIIYKLFCGIYLIKNMFWMKLNKFCNNYLKVFLQNMKCWIK